MARWRADVSGHSSAIPRRLRRFPTVSAGSEWGVSGPSPASQADSAGELREPPETEPVHKRPQLVVVTRTTDRGEIFAEADPDCACDAASEPPVRGLDPGLALVARLKGGQAVSDESGLAAVLGQEVSPSTLKNYLCQWKSFAAWARRRGISALPADPAQVAAYLAERIEDNGNKPSTLRAAAAAISFIHKACRLDNPCSSPEVKGTLKNATRKAGRAQKQAEALTAEALAAIESTAHRPRVGRGGRPETPQTAQRRADVDIAIISLMRDAMLRVSEAADLVWADVNAEADGTGRLLIRRSKTDTEGEGAIAFISAPTMAKLDAIRNKAAEDESIFGLRPNQIALRIKKAAAAAGLGDGFSGHSPKVGMARDLARAGIELPSLMNAGRWSTPSMPALYIRNETAGRGAVAQFYQNWRK